MKKISILVPMYNEQEVLPALFDRLSALMDANTDYDWEVVMVNDGSSDNTASMALAMHERDARFHCVDLSRNYGKETAMLAGFDTVSGDCTVIMDADLQHPPEVIPKMVEKWEQGYDDVYGMRITRGKEPWLRKKLSLLYYNLLQRTTRVPVLKNVGDFRLLDRACINALRKLRETHRYTKGLYCYIGFRKAEVPFEQADREAGETKWNFVRLLGLAIEGITSYTTLPLRFATIVGGIVSVAAMLYLMFILFKTVLVGEPVAGFPTLMVSILFLGGVILLTLGVMGEYLARIFDESKRRPVYFIREIDGKRQTDGCVREIE
ncbi:MAG: glycosyltransferase family 2 protein [Duncaniella sp.]|nr:glycosyltransferase family 2 protein [Duncaniella sp.]MDE5734365.1 glycosyltransferase family 2 protein [Duncaniella sp.]MDE6178729.1 glycosyltransferase family 2 protein [Duncaniella sp.]